MRGPRLEALRYGAAAILLAVASGGLALALAGEAHDEAASQADSAVMVELPAADASAHPESDAETGPEQQAQAAAQASPDLPTPPDPKPPDPKPPDPTPPTEPIETPPPAPQAAEPTPHPEERPDMPAQSSPQAAAAAQVEMAPAGAEAPDPKATDEGDAGRPHPSAHAITLWQRSLMKRLEGARRQFGAAPHASGTVTVAFSIDAHGALVSRRVEKSSGSAALDAAGLQLVQQAAPFPTPPAGSRDNDLAFAVPIRFR